MATKCPNTSNPEFIKLVELVGEVKAYAMYARDQGLESIQNNISEPSLSESKPLVSKIISGGQTGADRLGLEIAFELGIETGGLAPKGFKTEKGNDKTLADFGLKETASSGYTERTKDNALTADGTVLFGNMKSAGSKQTLSILKNSNKPHITNPTSDELSEWLSTNNINVLNVAGNRGSKLSQQQLSDISTVLREGLVSKALDKKNSLLSNEQKDVLTDEAGLIPGIHIKTQEHSVSNISRRMIVAAVKNGEDMGSLEKAASAFVDKVLTARNGLSAKVSKINKALDAGAGTTEQRAKLLNLHDRYTREIEVYNILVEDVKKGTEDSKIISRVRDYLSSLTGFNFKKSKLDKDENRFENEEQEIDSENTANWSDNYTLTTDSKTTMSSELRFFLASINDKRVNKEGQIEDKLDFLGDKVSINFNNAYEELHRVTSDLNPDYETIIQELEKYADSTDPSDTSESKLWINELILKLDNSPMNVQAGFVVDMTKHYVDMQMLSYERKRVAKADGFNPDGTPKYKYRYEYGLTLKNSNQSGLTTGNLMAWSNNMRQSPLMTYDTTLEEYVYTISDEDLERINKKAIKLSKTHINKNNIELNSRGLRSFLREFGVDLEKEAAEELVKRRRIYLNNGVQYTFRDFKNTLLNDLMSTLKNVKTQSETLIDGKKQKVTIKDVNIVNQSTMRPMAAVNAKYTPNLFTNSTRVGDKTVYSYVNNKYVTDRLRDLKSNHKGIVDELSDTVYARHSYFLERLASEEANNLKEWLKIGYVSLKPLDTPANSRQRSLPELTDGEHEFTKVGNFFANKNWRTNGGDFVERKGLYFYPTSSDKSVNMSVEAPVIRLDYTKSGVIVNSQLDLIIDNVIQSEWDRIHNGLNGEGDRQFYFFPEMNQKKIRHINNDGKTIEEITLNALAIQSDNIDNDTRAVLRQIVMDRLENMKTEKVEFWKANEIGISTRDKDGNEKERFKFMDIKAVSAIREHNKDIVTNRDSILGLMANEMNYNYMLTLANMFQLFIGDTALYHKKDNKFRKDAKGNKKVIDDTNRKELNNREHLLTLDNLGKRMASEIAPGKSLSNHVFKKETLRLFGEPTTKYIQMYLNDFTTATRKDILDQYTKLFKDNVDKEQDLKAYKEIDTTDAQEYTTWREHLLIMLASDMIKENEYRDITETLEAGKDLKGHLLKLVMTPLKPVHTNQKRYKVGDKKLEKRVYIKSSSFPLLPQLTRSSEGSIELDKLRVFMEKTEQEQKMPVRAAYNTAVKVGFPQKTDSSNGVENIFNEDGTMNEPVGHDWDSEYAVPNGNNVVFERLDREGFRIQQDIPFKHDKNEVRTGSQESKLIFGNILGIGEDSDKDKFVYDDKKYTGRELKDEYISLVKKQFNRQFDNFQSKFKTKDGKLKNHKIAKLLAAELERLGTPTISEKKGLEIDSNGEFVTPLWLSPHAKKYGSLINSLIFQNTIKRTQKGRSYVLGSEAGFRESANGISGIVTTDSYNGEELLPMRTEKDDNGNDVVKPAQIMLTFSAFKDINKINGKDKGSLRLRDFMSGGKIDHSKLPKELLQGFGFRIPTQSHSSMTYFEIVGFLPESQGDLVIAPKEFVAQMGSDFDVDKLYNYFYNTYVNSHGELTKVRIEDATEEEEEFLDVETGEITRVPTKEKDKYSPDYDADIQNRILDIHISVMSNPHPDVQRSIMKPLDFGLLGKYRDMFAVKGDTEFLPTYLSSDYNRNKYLSGVSGKSGTGFFASATVFNTSTQGHNNHMWHNEVDIIDGKKVTYPVREYLKFGEEYAEWDGDLSNAKSMKKTNARHKSEIFAGFLSAAVDNEKERLLDSLNINSETFSVIGLLIQAGFEEDIILPFLNQPAILDYISEVKANKSILKSYESPADIAQRMLSKYSARALANNDNAILDPSIAEFNGENAEEVMVDLITNGTNRNDYNEYQAALLNKYIELENQAVAYKNGLQLGNIDSKGMGKNIVEAVHKMSTMQNVIAQKGEIKIENLNSLLNDSPSGMAFANYRQGINLFNSQFIILEQSNDFEKIIGDYAVAIGKDNKSDISAEEYARINDAIKYYALGYHSDRRAQLLRGPNSIRKRMLKIQNRPEIKGNKFFNKIDLSNSEKAKGYDGITFSMNLTNEFINDEVYQHLVDALNSEKVVDDVDIRQLAEDVVEYGILDGARFSPQSFSKYIPTIYFERLGLNYRAHGLSLDREGASIMEQFIQHNPDVLPTTEGKQDTNTDTFKPKVQPETETIYLKAGFGKATAIYKRSQHDNKFHKISMLGDAGTLFEYSVAKANVAESIIHTNKPGKTKLDSGIYSEGIQSQALPNRYNHTLGGDEILDDGSFNLTEEEQDLLSVVKRIGDDPIAISIINHLSPLLEGYTASVVKGQVAGGLHNSVKKTITISDSIYNSGDRDLLIEVFLHETIHALTVHLLNNRDTLTKEQQMIINQISSYRLDVISKLDAHQISEFGEEIKMQYNYYVRDNKAKGNKSFKKVVYDELYGLNKQLNGILDEIISDPNLVTVNNDILSGANRDFYYGLVNDKEFLAILATNKDARAELDNVLGEVNTFTKILDWVKELFEYLGINPTASGKIVKLMFDLTYSVASDRQDAIDKTNAGDIIGMPSNEYTKVSGDDGAFTYQNSAKEILTDDQITNLRLINTGEADNQMFPILLGVGETEVAITSDGHIIDSRGWKLNYAEAKTTVASDEVVEFMEYLDKVNTTDATKFPNVDKFKVIADSYIAKGKGEYVQKGDTIFFANDIFEIGTDEGNIFDSFDHPELMKEIVGEGPVELYVQEDTGIDHFKSINGRDFINELSPAQKRYVLKLEQDGLITINC